MAVARLSIARQMIGRNRATPEQGWSLAAGNSAGHPPLFISQCGQ